MKEDSQDWERLKWVLQMTIGMTDNCYGVPGLLRVIL